MGRPKLKLMPPWQWLWSFQRGVLIVGAHCSGPDYKYVFWTKVIRLWRHS